MAGVSCLLHLVKYSKRADVSGTIAGYRSHAVHIDWGVYEPRGMRIRKTPISFVIFSLLFYCLRDAPAPISSQFSSASCSALLLSHSQGWIDGLGWPLVAARRSLCAEFLAVFASFPRRPRLCCVSNSASHIPPLLSILYRLVLSHPACVHVFALSRDREFFNGQAHDDERGRRFRLWGCRGPSIPTSD